MNTKSVEQNAAGYPVLNGKAAKEKNSYNLRALRKGPKIPRAASNFLPVGPAVDEFERKILGKEPEEPELESNIVEDIKQEILPILTKTLIGLVAHGEALKSVVSKTISFSIVSAKAVAASVKLVMRRAAERD